MCRSRIRKALTTLAAVLALVLTLVVQASASPPTSTSSTGATPQHWRVLVAAQTHHGAIQTMPFYPAHLWIDQGDSVTWTANAAEIHTVTFLSSESPCPQDSLCALPPGFNPGDPTMSIPHGGAVYDGSSYYSSGVLTTAKDGAMPLPPFVHVRNQYTLTFPSTLAPGTYTYYCLVHGKMMQGKIIVQAAGTPYPFTQKQYNQRDRAAIRSDFADGMRLWKTARKKAAALSRKNGPTVLAGAMDDRTMVMRFVPHTITTRVGGKVHFLATRMGEPHVVTFGDDKTGCGAPPCDPSRPWNTVITSDGNEAASYPGHNGGFTGSPTELNSGVLLGAPPSMTGAPQQLTLTLTKRGSYPYSCALHDYMGMLGTVAVTPAHARTAQ